MLGKQNKQTSFLDIESWVQSPLVDPNSIYGMRLTGVTDSLPMRILPIYTARPVALLLLLLCCLKFCFSCIMTMYQTEKPKNGQNLICAGKSHCICRWVKVVLTTLHCAVSGAGFLQIKDTSSSLNVLQTWPKKPGLLKKIVCRLLIPRMS